MEAEMVDVASEVGGVLTELDAGEGETVQAGQLLARLDDKLPRARVAQAEAAVELAKARLALLEAGAREEEIRKAQAQIAQAEAAERGAEQAWKDAQAVADDPQQLDLEIVEAETALAQAEHQAKAAHLSAQAADLQVQAWKRTVDSLRGGVDVPLPGGGYMHLSMKDKLDKAYVQWNLASQQAWEAWQAAYRADAEVEGARSRLEDLRERRKEPKDLLRKVKDAEAAYRQAQPPVEMAKAALRSLEEGPTPEQVDAASARVKQAEGALAEARNHLAKTVVRAPRSGVIMDRFYHVGEMAPPGAPIFRIADLSKLTLTVYVSEEDLGKVALGQEVRITVDSYPGRTFVGKVTHIADEAEFTPKNVQTKEERVDLVFAVEVTVPNPDGLLKPGMPADAIIETGGER
jgi:multidrug resistance efflux pump